MSRPHQGQPCWCCGRAGVHIVEGAGLRGKSILLPCLVCEGNTPANYPDFTDCVDKQECENSYPSRTRTKYIEREMKKLKIPI